MIPAVEYSKRRDRLFANMPNNSALLVFAGKAKSASADETYPFEVNRNFYYLTGIDQEGSSLLLINADGEKKEYLFVDPYNPVKEKWYGKKLTPEEAKDLSDVSNVLLTSALTAKLDSVLNEKLAEFGSINTLFLDLEKELKIGIVNPSMIPDYVILDAEMIRNLPRSIGAATGIDAMAHAIECFTSNKANPFSDTFALEAFDLIINNIERACDDPTAMDAKNKMQIAAFYGGAAIACSGTTAVHALSYPLGGKYHIAHGVSNAILLVPVMEFNEPAIRDRLAVAYDRVVHGEKTCTTVEEKSAWVVRRMGEIVKHLDIPTSLKEFNVSPDDLESLVEAGMQVTRLLVNNMREVTAEDARNIYKQIL